MAMSLSQENEILPELRRPAMHVDLFKAAIKGDSNVLIRRLGLPPEARNDIQVTIGASYPYPQKIEAQQHQIVQSELRSMTRSGDTLLHLLITKKHNELALKVFPKDMSLLKAQNKKSETPLHCAAKVGNKMVICDLIRLAPGIVKDALGETDQNGNTAVHVAANHKHGGVVRELMELDPEVSGKENKQGFSPLYIAIVKGYTSLVKAMLEVDASLACTQFFDGTFPVHVAARTGNTNLVVHFLQEYHDDAELLDSCGRNIFHMAAEQANAAVFTEVFAITEDGILQISKMVERMINATDYEGNTPLHIAAMKGHRKVMSAIWDKLNHDQGALLQNQLGETAFDLSIIQLTSTNKDITRRTNMYVRYIGSYFTELWFDQIMEQPLANNLQKIQVVGLGAVLIATVAFAAAFTVPGGYNADDGTPILGRRYMFRAFILANTLAFILSFACVFVITVISLTNRFFKAVPFEGMLFFTAASSMVLAFGLGSYVVLAPISMPIARIVFIVALLFGSPSLPFVIVTFLHLWMWIINRRAYWQRAVLEWAIFSFPMMFIFFLAFL